MTSYTLDELQKLMGDTYDALVTPFRIFRDNANKLWLILQGTAAGLQLINDMVVSLSNKFDPANSSDADLLSTAKLVGTAFKIGKSSFVQINVVNTDSALPHTLLAGQYQYTSVSGQVFYMTLGADLSIAASTTKTLVFQSADKGAFAVSAITNVSVSRTDLVSIDANFNFNALNNARYLGYLDETPLDFRVRVLNDTNRQDAIAELELELRNLPNILEATLIFNPTQTGVAYDGITIPPFFLLVVVTGFPYITMAEAVIEFTPYLTVQVDPDDTFNIVDSHFTGGVFPVHFTPHGQTNFTLAVTYRFDGNKIIQANAETAMRSALMTKYASQSQYINTVTVGDFLNVINDLNLTSVQPLQVIMDAGAGPINYLDFLKTRLANLTTVTFVGIDVS